MSFDGVFLHKLMNEFQILKTGRITKIIDSGETDFMFTIRANHQNFNLMICLSSDYSRIHLAQKKYDTPDKPKSITMLFRKYIEGFFIEDIFQYENDRIIYFKLSGYNEMKDQTTYYLICEIMGRYSNLILTDEQFKIVEVLKKSGVTEYTRTMLPNAIYQFPVTDKINPFKELPTDFNCSSPKDFCAKIQGISMLLATAVFQTDQVLTNFKKILSLEPSPSILLNEKGKKDFYFHSLHYDKIQSYSSLSELLEEYYYESDTQAKIKSETNDLESFIQKQIHKNERKLEKLHLELLESEHNEEYKLKGELLLSYPRLKDKEKQLELLNYYTNEAILIDLDPKYSVLENSQRYYKKYQKTKTAIHYINEQMKAAQNEIDYFKILLFQLNTAGIHDALEIKQELIQNKYLFENKDTLKKKKKPNYLTYILDGINISVGKNNIQNEYITHHLAKPNEMWFHIKDGSGSHVVVHSDVLNEELIRTAAQLAAYYSSYSLSSSVAVDYTQVKNIKKIPGVRSCFVTYTKQKTIYIDPDKHYIESLRILK